MSTRASIHFMWGTDIEANVYRHYDGDPETMTGDLAKFFADVKTGAPDTRFSDPSYLAAKFVVWQAGQYARAKETPLDFSGVGVQVRDPGDIEYIYEISADLDESTGFPQVTWRRA